MFITFEANEGSGKTTQAKLLHETLVANGQDTLLTREPGGSPLAEELRQLVLTGDANRMDVEIELLIFTAARRDHTRKIVTPALERGSVVVCDRYLGSTFALQGAAGVDPAQIQMLHDNFVQLMPDLTIFIDIDVEQSLDRAFVRMDGNAAAENRMESKGMQFHRAVDKGFRKQLAERPEWVSVDGSGSIKDVQRRIWDVVSRHPVFPLQTADVA
jgi:dTMP kinase